MNVIAKILTNILANTKMYNKDTLKAFTLKSERGQNV